MKLFFFTTFIKKEREQPYKYISNSKFRQSDAQDMGIMDFLDAILFHLNSNAEENYWKTNPQHF